jgi:hypothetical protein
MDRQIVITGGNGWIGGYAGSELSRRGWRVTGVSRSPAQARDRRPEWSWVGVEGEELESAVEQVGAVLNLAGRHVLEQPWSPEYVQEMRESRLRTTRRVVAALRRSSASERVLANASGYPIYGDVGEDPVTEDRPTSRDLVAGAMDDDWEHEAQAASDGTTRVALLRLGLVLGHDGGAFPVLREPFRSGTGVTLGSGRQWMPWVHVEDVARLVADIVEGDYRGPVNVVAPQPARHADFAATLGGALGISECPNVPAEQVETMLGGAAELLLASQRMTPERALRHGFRFEYDDITSAIKDLVSHG